MIPELSIVTGFSEGGQVGEDVCWGRFERLSAVFYYAGFTEGFLAARFIVLSLIPLDSLSARHG